MNPTEKLIKEFQDHIAKLPFKDQFLVSNCYEDILTIINRPDYIHVSPLAMGLIGAQIQGAREKFVNLGKKLPKITKIDFI
jgi:hypothetical protein